ncbi:MAG: HupE/UreJ family protein [Ginsengibacter sp.]
MNDAELFFSLGWHHIISSGALDHILFITALSAIYIFNDWKKVLILVTAFTIGHSLTLALSVYDVIRINGKLVEILIPCTIVITAVFNFFQKKYTQKKIQLNYFFALFFGLIHGMGFANSIRFMLPKDENIAIPLLSFNIGLEAGQIVIVVSILLASYFFITILHAPRKVWVYFLSGIALIASLQMIVERLRSLE